MKILILIITIICSPFLLANELKGEIFQYKNFKTLNFKEKVQFIKKLQETASLLEKQHRKAYKYADQKNLKTETEYKNLKHLFVSLFSIDDANAAEIADKNICVFAGWIGDISSKGKTLLCEYSEIKANNAYAYKESLINQKSGCDENKGYITCNPLLFGTTKSGKVFCTNRASPAGNSSKHCLEQAQKIMDPKSSDYDKDYYQKLFAKIDSQKDNFNLLMTQLRKVCFCGLGEGVNTYRDILYKRENQRSTCEALFNQLKNILLHKENETDENYLICSKFQGYDRSKTNLYDLIDEIKRMDSKEGIFSNQAEMLKLCKAPEDTNPPQTSSTSISLEIEFDKEKEDKTSQTIIVKSLECISGTEKVDLNNFSTGQKICSLGWDSSKFSNENRNSFLNQTSIKVNKLKEAYEVTAGLKLAEKVISKKITVNALVEDVLTTPSAITTPGAITTTPSAITTTDTGLSLEVESTIVDETKSKVTIKSFNCEGVTEKDKLCDNCRVLWSTEENDNFVDGDEEGTEYTRRSDAYEITVKLESLKTKKSTVAIATIPALEESEDPSEEVTTPAAITTTTTPAVTIDEEEEDDDIPSGVSGQNSNFGGPPTMWYLMPGIP